VNIEVLIRRLEALEKKVEILEKENAFLRNAWLNLRTPRTVGTVPYLLPRMRTVLVYEHPRAKSHEFKRDERARPWK